MLHQAPARFDETKQALARALYDAGQSDTEIGLAVGLPPANIADWRQRQGLPDHKPPMSADMQRYLEQARPKAAAPEPALKPMPAAPRSPDLAPAPAASSRPAARPAAPSSPLSGAGVQPTGENALEIGADGNGKAILVDLEELLTTRLLVQGNSGSGKSHLLRRVIEESTGVVQQVIIDPEGDFVTLGDTFGHKVIDGSAYSKGQLANVAAKVRQHRASVILDLSRFEGSDAEDEGDDDVTEKQMDAVAAFLSGLFNAPKEHWHPALVFVDEAQVFAPSSNASLDIDRAVRRRSVSAMADLMCRGRKRGLAGILATQRLAKLATNVAGEVSNFLMGRTFFDADIARAGELLGMARKDASIIGDLTRGEFIGVGPAVARRPLKVKVGATMTSSPNGSIGLTPLPAVSAEQLETLLLPDEEPSAEVAAQAVPPRLHVVK